MLADSLRKSILQAAIEGKLTKREPVDGDARDLLTEIQKEKKRLVMEGKIRRSTPLPPVADDEIPFDIPDNWCWVRLGEIVNINPRNVLPDDLLTGFLPMERIEAGYGSICNPIPKTWKEIKSGFTHFKNSDIIIAKITPCFQNLKSAVVSGLINGYGAGTTELHVLRTYGNTVNNRYLLFIAKSRYFIEKGVEVMTGTAGQQRVGSNFIKNFLIPLPPLAEQRRIVARLEELLPLIDALDGDERELEAIEREFPDAIRKSLLQAAIEGKLTKREPGDGDARDLLAEIQKEKARLVREGKIRRSAPLPPIADDEIPFDIPDNWRWVRLGECTFNHGQKVPDKNFTYIDIGSINNKGNKLDKTDNILSPKEAPSRARKIVFEDDLIYATVRPYLHNACVIDKRVEPEPIVSTGFAVLSMGNSISNRYLLWVFLSPMFDSYANDTENSKGVAYPAINDNKLLQGLIPLPPLAEQKRIVARLEELLPLVYELGKL